MNNMNNNHNHTTTTMIYHPQLYPNRAWSWQITKRAALCDKLETHPKLKVGKKGKTHGVYHQSMILRELDSFQNITF
jgi:hypothetical protein